MKEQECGFTVWGTVIGMRSVLFVITSLLLGTVCTSTVAAGELPALEVAAGKLRAATVTVRVRNPRSEQDALQHSGGGKSSAEADSFSG